MKRLGILSLEDEGSARRIDRRHFVKSTIGLAATAPLVLSGCEDFIRAIAGTCPDDMEESGGVTWAPDVMHPVFYGHQDLSTEDGAPTTLRIWYPTYEGFTAGPPILKLCVFRYPVVLFLHGQPPCPDPDYYRWRWFAIPAVLARSGYVVVVPRHDAAFPEEENPPSASLALDILDWVRDGWSESRWVDGEAESTAVAGHSYGALLAARLVALRPSISAFVGLGAPWDELSDRNAVLRGLTLPKLFMWGEGLFFEDLGRLWDALPAPKHGVIYEGEHFDYIRDHPECSEARGPCTALEFGTADLVALFLARYVPVRLSSTHVPASLEPPAVPLTTEQQFYAGGRLGGLQSLQSAEQCSVELRWEDGGPPGSRTLAA